jgi:dipeptidyl aminopeptidase/acylaminoacyl peptidase
MRKLLFPLVLGILGLPAAALGATLVTSGGGDGAVIFKGASADAKHVVFATRDRLSPLDRDSSWDLYDRAGAATRLVSTGTGASASSAYPTLLHISSDGSRVLFSTTARLTPADRDHSVDLYERSGGRTRLVTGGRRDLAATYKGASLDGRRVIFQSREALTSDDRDSRVDVFRASDGQIVRLSQGPAGGDGAFDAGLPEFTPPDAAGSLAQISPDGLRVAFRTSERLTADDQDDVRDYYVSTPDGLTRLSPGAASPARQSFSLGFGPVSANGSHVFFETADRLAAADTDDAPNLYESTPGGPRLVEGLPAGGLGVQAVSEDGLRFVFTSEQRLAPGDSDNEPDVYELGADGLTRLLSPAAPGAYTNPFGIRIANGNRVRGAGFDDDRNHVFVETRDQLSAADTDHQLDVYVLQADRAPQLVSAGPSGGNTNCFPVRPCAAYFEAADAAGDLVLFQTAERLAPDDTDDYSDLYASRDGKLTKLSPGNGPFDVLYRSMTPDGRTVDFTTAEPLVASDRDHASDVYAVSP